MGNIIRKLKNKIKERACDLLNLPYSGFSLLPHSLLRHLKRQQPITLVDIGAHEGLFTKSINDWCGISKAILVEPIPEKAQVLNRLFTSPQYQIYVCALSSKNGVEKFRINEGFNATSSLLKIKRGISELSKLNLGKERQIEIQTKTLDDILSSSSLNFIDLLKIDVQGAEHLVFEGAKKALNIVSMIWIEVSFKPLYDGSSTFENIYNYLSQTGYILAELEPGFRGPNGELLQADALFIKK